jgi:chemotaxis protein methyltransferase CheR
MRGFNREAIERFQALIAERLGLSCSEWQAERLPILLYERVQKSPYDDVTMYLQRLSRPDLSQGELGALAEQLTVGETYFFRESKQIDALLAVALPELGQRRRRGERLRVLSAGCSSGEEAYTLAIALRQYLGETAWREASILGIDMNPAAIRRARQAVYSAWSLRSTPKHIRERWFSSAGQDFRLRDEIRAMVDFEERNLLTDDPSFWKPDSFDILFCRNVTIYFSHQATRALITRVERALAPGGFLFLGHSETLRGISDEFELMNTHETFYYRRKPQSSSQRPKSARNGEPAGARIDELRAVFQSESWVEAIQRSTERIAAFTRPVLPPAQGQQAPTRDPAATANELATALELFKAERFIEAMALLEPMRKSVPIAPDVELLAAVICSNQGLFDEAERICQRLIQAGDGGDRGAAAHYLLGLCFEHAGNRGRAMDHHRSAIRLDPSFSMPHLHLGLLARRAGDIETARSEMRLAAGLVSCERQDRIVLFGGGFHRKALLELCRAELCAVGDAP